VNWEDKFYAHVSPGLYHPMVDVEECLSNM
jgi:hypothetical protein